MIHSLLLIITRVKKCGVKEKKVHTANTAYIKSLLFVLHKLKKYGALLPVIAFNQSFDLGVFVKYWPKKCLLVKGDFDKHKKCMAIENNLPKTKTNRNGRERVDKNYNVYICKKDIVHFPPQQISTTFKYKKVTTGHGINFLDLQNYLSAKTSLSGALKQFEVPAVKGFFPYSALSQPELLKQKLKNLSHKEHYALYDNDLSKKAHRVKHNTWENDWQQKMESLYGTVFQPEAKRICTDLTNGLEGDRDVDPQTWDTTFAEFMESIFHSR